MAATDYDFNRTRNEIIQDALRMVGVLGKGEILEGEDLDIGVAALNSLVQSWQTRGVFLWTLRECTETLVAATKTYAVKNDPSIIAIEKAYLTIGSNDTELDVISWREYEDIVDKNASGDPTLIALDARVSPTIYTWPVVATSGRSLKYLGVSKLKDFDTAAGTADMPVRFVRALKYGLAADLADDTRLSLNERQYIQTKAEVLFLEALGSDMNSAQNSFVKGAFCG